MTYSKFSASCAWSPELCRKHCGYQDKWVVGLVLPQKKTGAHSPAKKFRYLVKRLAASDHLPEYHLRFAKDQLTAYPRTQKGGLRAVKDLMSA